VPKKASINAINAIELIYLINPKKSIIDKLINGRQLILGGGGSKTENR
jgi:hypothetical protein